MCVAVSGLTPEPEEPGDAQEVHTSSSQVIVVKNELEILFSRRSCVKWPLVVRTEILTLIR